MALSDVLSRLVNPTNPLGQLGQAFLSASGGPIGGAFQNLIQQRQFMMQHALQAAYQQSRIDLDERRARAPVSHVVGSDVINEDPMTGQEINRIHGTAAPTDMQRNIAALPQMVASGQITQEQADSYRSNLMSPLHWMQVDNPATGGHDIIPYNNHGPIAAQANGGAPAHPLTDADIRTLDQAAPPQTAAPAPGGPVRTGFNSYRSDAYAPIEASVEQQLGLPSGILGAIRTRGERSNADQVSPAGAQTVYQVIPSTRAGVMRNYGVDAYGGPPDAAMAAGLILREAHQRTGDWNQAITQYHGGSNPANWGPRTRAYGPRVGSF